MGSEHKTKVMGTFYPAKKTSRLSLASRGHHRKTETFKNPLGKQNPYEDRKPILGDRLGCGWASRRPFEAVQPFSNGTGKGTPPHPKTQKNPTHDTWDNVSASKGSLDSESQGSLVGGHSLVSGSKTPSNISDRQKFISTASETGRCSHPEGNFSPAVLREYQQDGSKSTDKALVVLTDLRHDPLYGKTIARLQKDIGLESNGRTTLGELWVRQ